MPDLDSCRAADTARIIFKHFRAEIYATLALKTNWGRNELELAIERAINSALLSFMEGER